MALLRSAWSWHDLGRALRHWYPEKASWQNSSVLKRVFGHHGSSNVHKNRTAVAIALEAARSRVNRPGTKKMWWSGVGLGVGVGPGGQRLMMALARDVLAADLSLLGPAHEDS